LQLREETLSGIIDGMTARFIEAQGAVEEIERLREAIVEIVYQIGQGNNMAAMDIAAPIAAAYLQQRECE
jgi:hypothetical protein